ncbi:hypothetical protein HDU76_008072 [Blyttiomyces sp. JEL0837]|nr:hypothetical protein HDU76_008072 [Blyttiomyces sp. JEL0837]
MSSSGQPKMAEAKYEEYMKIVVENKINASNSWNLALIDYFHDQKSLQEGDSINFQKASCTLDGCVKIYSSRIDSVDSEAKLLLNNLVDSNIKETSEDNDEEGNAESGEKKKRGIRTGNTLEKDFSSLNVKKLDLEYLVDPLFRKTSADFDEGSASGLLLNHLSMANEGRIVFDASDDASITQKMTDDTSTHEFPRTMIDISKIREKFLPNLRKVKTMEICPSLRTFEFSGSSVPTITFDMANYDSSAWSSSFKIPDPSTESSLPEMNDDWAGDDDDFAGGPTVEEYNPDNDDDITGGGGGQLVLHGAPRLEYDERAPDAEASFETLFNYFDAKLVKRWAGPQQWRPQPLRKDKPEQAPAEKKKRKKARINFSEPVKERDLFIASSVPSIPKYTENAKWKNLLPNDQHFSSNNLLKLFLKPNAKILSRTSSSNAVERIDGDQLDAEYWSQHQNDDMFFSTTAAIEDGTSHNNLPTPDFGHDMDDDISDEMEFDTADLYGGSSALEFGDSLVAEPKKVKAAFMHYAKRPKRIDVKKLKENLWVALAADEEQQMSQDNAMHDTKQFSAVLRQVESAEAVKSIGEISPAFCFICLLHLANERNLVIKQNDDFTDLTVAPNY